MGGLLEMIYMDLLENFLVWTLFLLSFNLLLFGIAIYRYLKSVNKWFYLFGIATGSSIISFLLIFFFENIKSPYRSTYYLIFIFLIFMTFEIVDTIITKKNNQLSDGH